VLFRSRDLELFHLAADLGETTNLAEREPEHLALLEKLLREHDAQMVEPLWGGDTRARPTRSNVPLKLLDRSGID